MVGVNSTKYDNRARIGFILKNSHCITINNRARRKASEHFRLRTYHRRELIESGNSALKRKYGSSVSSRSAQMIRAELYLRLNCHNLFLKIIEI